MKTNFSLSRHFSLPWPAMSLRLAVALAASALSLQARADTVGVPWTGAPGITETVADIMARDRAIAIQGPGQLHTKPVLRPDRSGLPQNPNSPATTETTARTAAIRNRGPFTPQTIGTTFLGATLADTSAFPPDTMGAVGPSQFIVAVNGRIRSFNKTTGLTDGALNSGMDAFFASVTTPVGGSIIGNFTSDPHIRYDRLSGRWIIVMIDVPYVSLSPFTTSENRIMIAVSSGGIITNTSSFTFYQFRHDQASTVGDTGDFADYPTPGIDANAIYIGDNVFGNVSGSFVGCSGFVVRKSSVLSGGPIVVTAFRGLATGAGAGLFTPQGVDNYDPAATEGYFVAVDNAVFGQLDIRRVSTPGGTPSISGNLTVAVSTTTSPLKVPHLGNTGGTSGKLDALDDRLYAAHLRNGRLWTAHNIQVNSAGTASASGGRNGSRWYELQNLTGAPSLVQSGTMFDSAASNPKNFWIPSIMVSGQGHVAMGFSTAGTNNRANAGTVGRLAGDTLGTMQTPVDYTASSTAYNPPSDPGGSGGRRWGDYSYTSVDPSDDMTMWTIQEFCNAANTYGVQVVKLIAPPPATPASCDTSVAQGAAGANVILTGTAVSGSGFYDPGVGFSNRISAAVGGAGVTVNSVTYSDSTHITLNVSVAGGATPGARTVTVTNPDGQAVASGAGILTVTASITAAPTATTLPPTMQSNTVATLNASVNPNSQATAAWFEWGLTANNYINHTATNTLGSGGATLAISNSLTGLTPRVVYHGRVVATNASGLVHGSDVMFGSPAVVLNGAAMLTIPVNSIFTDPGATSSNAPLAIVAGGLHILALKGNGTVVAWGDNSSGQTNVPVGLSNVVAIAGGDQHSLALKSDGTVVAWGLNDVGQTNIPVGLGNVVAIAGGDFHSLALKGDGTVVAWGDNGDGQTNVPVGLSNVVAIAGGESHSLALKSDGTVVAWGNNGDGQTNVPAGLNNVVAIAGADQHSLALKSDGTVVAWGLNDVGQTNIPVGLSSVVAIAGGDAHSLALKGNGTVVAWGDNLLGQTNVPAGSSNLVAIAGGGDNSLALKSDGTVVPWGDNSFGQTNIPAGLNTLSVIVSGTVNPNVPGTYTLTYTSTNALGGVGSVTRTVIVASSLPTVVTLPPTAVSNTLATLNGSVNPNSYATTAWFEWGVAANNYTHQTAPTAMGSGAVAVALNSQLAGLTPGVLYHARAVATNIFGLVHGSDVLFGTPVLVLNGAPVVTLPTNSIFIDPGANGAPLAIAANGNHSLALLDDGTVDAWGNDFYGQTDVSSDATNVVSIAAGSYHSLALRADGMIIGWGDNGDGQIVAPVSATNVVSIAGGANHTLARRADGVVLSWGDNHFGQTNQPAGLTNIVAIAAGGVHNLALRPDGTVVGWGFKYAVETNVPIGLTNVLAIAVGGNHSLALRTDGTVVAWGYNNNGQTNVPAGLVNVVAIAAGGTHSLALRANGTVAAWGNNSSGQIAPPVNATSGLAIAGGTAHSLMLKADGTVIGWGNDTFGQIDIPPDLNVSDVIVTGTVNLGVPGVYVLTYTLTNALGGVSTVTRTIVVGTVASLPSVLKGVTRLGNGSFRFSFTNQSGANFSVLTSTNIALPVNTWSNLGPAVEAPAGQFQFTDPQATNNPLRFYRVRSP